MKPIIFFAALAVASTLVSIPALADWSVSADLTRFSDRYDLDIASVGIGYEHRFEESNFAIMPMAKYGVGLGDDEFRGIEFEVDQYIELMLRSNYYLSDKAYFFAQAGYGELTIEVNSAGELDEWEFGGGAGAGAKFTDHLSAEVSYQYFDNTDVFSLSVRYRF